MRSRWSDTDRILYEIERVRQNTVEILELLPKARPLGAMIAAIHGRRCVMPVTIPVPQLLDTEKILCSVMPRKRDGHVSTQAVVAWAANGDAQIEVGTAEFIFHDPQFDEDVTCPGSFNCYALTPGASGTGTVSVSGSDAEGVFDTAEFGPITWAPGQPRSLNASIGSPISDL